MGDITRVFVPAWDNKGNLQQEPTRIYYTVEALTDNFSSEVVASNVIELESIAIDEKPTDLKVSVMPFQNFIKSIIHQIQKFLSWLVELIK